MVTGPAVMAKIAQARVPVLLRLDAIDTRGWPSYSPGNIVKPHVLVREVPNEE